MSSPLKGTVVPQLQHPSADEIQNKQEVNKHSTGETTSKDIVSSHPQPETVC